MTRLARLRRSLEELFPERSLYIRSGGAMHAFVLTPSKQMAGAGVLAAAMLLMCVSTTALMINAVATSRAEQDAALIQAKYERWIADRQARLNSAVAQLNAADGSVNGLALDVEKRHAALALLLTDLKGAPGASEALTPVIDRALAAQPKGDPLRRVEMVRLSQDRLLDAAESFAKGRAERLRLAFRLTGLSPAGYVRGDSALGGPLIEAGDPRALAAILDVEEDFAGRVQRVANGLSEARALTEAAERLPIARPTDGATETSGFGVRFDPFTRRPAFHSGLDFSGASMTPIKATGPGVVSFTGQKAGYGKAIEIDHGRGLKTRYAHLQSIGVRVGERVAVGQRIGGMGSTGRSTGTHLHYEVWVNGRPQNPDRFVKAGRYVLEDS